jgi:hypothetical protein
MPLGLRFRKLLIQALVPVVSAQGCAQPGQDRSLIVVADGVGEEGVDGDVGGREQVVSQMRDGWSCQRVHLEMNVGHYFVGYVVLGGGHDFGRGGVGAWSSRRHWISWVQYCSCIASQYQSLTEP